MTSVLERTVQSKVDFATVTDRAFADLPDLSQAVLKDGPDFFSNDYLGLSTNPLVRERFLRKLGEEKCVLGSGGSRLQDGNTSVVVKLEKRLQDYFRGEAALVYNSGFEANVGLWSALPQENDVVLYDQLIHASMYDGLRTSKANKSMIPLKHNSIEHLRTTLRRLVGERETIRKQQSSVFVLVEGIYSMHGDFAPLKAISDTMKEELPSGVGQLFVDEAHSAGILGPKGRGLVSMLGMEDDVPLRLYTFSKAMGTSGAAIICPPLVRKYLIHTCRNLIYSTTFTHSNAVSMANAVDFVDSEMGDALARNVQEITAYARKALSRALKDVPKELVYANCDTPDHVVNGKTSAMIPLVTPEAVSLSRYLAAKGYSPREIVPPVVPKGHERIRVTFHATNTTEQVDGFVGALMEWVAEQMKSGRVQAESQSGLRIRAML